jgi:hypothetical protein
MKTRFRHDDLMYGVVLSAVISFFFAVVLDGVHGDDFAGMQAVAAPAAAAVASATQGTIAAR